MLAEAFRGKRSGSEFAETSFIRSLLDGKGIKDWTGREGKMGKWGVGRITGYLIIHGESHLVVVVFYPRWIKAG